MKERYKNIRRRFSEPFKQTIVKDLDNGRIRVSQVVTSYAVCSKTVYKWLAKYSIHYIKQSRVIIEMKSEKQQTDQLQQRVAELERTLGQKQMRIDYLEKLVEISQDKLGIDIEKKGVLPRSNGSGITAKNTRGK
jgi:transposase